MSREEQVSVRAADSGILSYLFNWSLGRKGSGRLYHMRAERCSYPVEVINRIVKLEQSLALAGLIQRKAESLFFPGSGRDLFRIGTPIKTRERYLYTYCTRVG